MLPITDEKIEELLGTPYWVIDILPKQVPKDSPGQYFTIEKYYLEKERFAGIKQKHIDLILKLNCYRELSLSEETAVNPDPKHIAEEIRKRFLYVMLGDSMILSEPDNTCLTVFNPDDDLLPLWMQMKINFVDHDNSRRFRHRIRELRIQYRHSIGNI